MRRFAILPVLALLLTLPGCASVLFGGVNLLSQRSGVDRVADISFDSAHHLALDVYRPSGAKIAPTVVFFYGGSWKNGQRWRYRFVGEALAAHGVVAIIPDSRTYPDVRFPAFVDDAARAVAWAHAHAAENGGNPDHLFIMGHSAGAHIAAMLATDAHYLDAVGLKPRDLSGFIGLAGPFDFPPLTSKDCSPSSAATQPASAPRNL